MRHRRFRATAGLLMAAVVLAVGTLAATSGAQDSSGGDSASNGSGGDAKVLRIGWAQDPSTNNLFVAYDAENFFTWRLNYDLLLNFSPEDLLPAPGVAEVPKPSDISDGGKTVTFHLDPDKTWSDGKPVTSKDVKWSLEVLGDNGVLFGGYTDHITKIETPDPHTIVLHTDQPDARLIGGLFIYILPEHVWGDVPLKDLNGSYEPPLPMVGSGPYELATFERGRLLTMTANPNFDGPQPKYDEIQFIKYGSEDAVERALRLEEIDFVPYVAAATFDRIGKVQDIDTLRSSSPSFTELSFNNCQPKDCPDIEVNPVVQDRAIHQAVAYAMNRPRVVKISSLKTSYNAHGLLPEYYKAFYEIPKQDYPYDLDKAKQVLDDAGWTPGEDGIREKDGMTAEFTLYARSETPADIQAANLIAEAVEPAGIKINVQIISTQKLTDLTTGPGNIEPDFDAFIWGWGGDPYDPSFLLGLMTTSQIGASSDSFYSNPEYDRLNDKQISLVGPENLDERKAVIQKMIAILQRDLPYIVLSYDPALQAWRSDRVQGIEPACPADTGDAVCSGTAYEPFVHIGPTPGAAEGGSDLTGLIVVGAGVVLWAAVYMLMRWRRNRYTEPLELETPA